jgi:predicted MFS family arabinose efflux permease
MDGPHMWFHYTDCSCYLLFRIRARLHPRKGQLFLLSAFKGAPYIAIIGASFLMMLGFFIPFFYIPTYAVAHGMSKELASYLVLILNGASLFGRIVPGNLADRLGRLNMFCAAGLRTGTPIFCLQKLATNASIIVFSALHGFFSGAIISMMSFCFASALKDLRDIGTYMGMGIFVVSFVALIGPTINGALVTDYRGFDQLSIFSGVVVLVGGFSVLLAKQATGKGVFGKI